MKNFTKASAPASVWARAAGGIATVAVGGLDAVVVEPLDGELVVGPPDAVVLLGGGSSPPPVHPAKPSVAIRPHAAY